MLSLAIIGWLVLFLFAYLVYWAIRGTKVVGVSARAKMNKYAPQKIHNMFD